MRRSSKPLAAETRASICVVAERPPSVSETFIRDHVERLPADVVFIHGWRPTVGSRPVLSLARRVLYKLARIFLRHRLEREITAGYSKAFRDSGAKAVLAEYGPSAGPTLDACRSLGLPLVVHFHGYDTSMRSVLDENAQAYSAVFRYAAAVIAVSREMERKLIAMGAPAEKVHYNPYGIDCRQFAGAEPASASPVFLAVGRFVEKKGPQLTIQAFARVHREHPEARLRIIGDGPLLAECRALAQQLGVVDAVTFLGPQPRSVVREEMRLARCFVQHSLEAASGDSEGTPVAVLEAGASGLPVVSTRHGGIPDVVIEGKTGLLVDERDVDGMATEMLRMIEKPELAARMGEAARRRIETTFSQDRSLGRLWSIIESCIEGGPVRPS